MIPKDQQSEQQPITLPLLQQKCRRVRNDLTNLRNDMSEFSIYIQQLFEDSKKQLETLSKK
jgi:hypothetical protein